MSGVAKMPEVFWDRRSFALGEAGSHATQPTRSSDPWKRGADKQNEQRRQRCDGAEPMMGSIHRHKQQKTDQEQSR
jgi:hypothetical protein